MRKKTITQVYQQHINDRNANTNQPSNTVGHEGATDLFNYVFTAMKNSNCDSMAEDKLTNILIYFERLQTENEALKEANRELLESLEAVMKFFPLMERHLNYEKYPHGFRIDTDKARELISKH